MFSLTMRGCFKFISFQTYRILLWVLRFLDSLEEILEGPDHYARLLRIPYHGVRFARACCAVSKHSGVVSHQDARH